MCLAVPGRIVKIKSNTATVDYELEKREGKILEKGYNVGDYVIIQGKAEAEEALKDYRENAA